jgi:NCAIR mutase (PurE)-related protein
MPEVIDKPTYQPDIFFTSMQQVGDAILDTHRQNRKGFPEVIFAEGKNIVDIINLLQVLTQSGLAIATRVTNEQANILQKEFSDGVWHARARVFIANPQHKSVQAYNTDIAIVTAGMSDVTIAEEAVHLLGYAGYPIHTIYDVGIAALHRLFVHIETLRACDVVIVFAGMDGALPAVIAGLIPQPVIAVPTSIGYGVAQHGMTALNTMLSSCAPGLAVVNIDNGYGAAMMAHAICQRIHKGKKNAK